MLFLIQYFNNTLDINEDKMPDISYTDTIFQHYLPYLKLCIKTLVMYYNIGTVEINSYSARRESKIYFLF